MGVEDVYTKSQVVTIINKAFLDGQKSLGNYLLNYINAKAEEVETELTYVSENGFTDTEKRIKSIEAQRVYFEVSKEVELVLELLEKEQN